jgi:hypothetical protein
VILDQNLQKIIQEKNDVHVQDLLVENLDHYLRVIIVGIDHEVETNRCHLSGLKLLFINN